MYSIDTSPACLLLLHVVYGDFAIHKFTYSHSPKIIYNQYILLYFEFAFVLIKTNSILS